MFDSSSRFAKASTYPVTDRRGRNVTVVEPAPPISQNLAGYHLRKAETRLDVLAGRYLGEPTAFWRIAQLADVMVPEALTLRAEIPIPTRS
jgi:hypothetical protein